MRKKAYSTEELIECLVKLYKTTGKVPTIRSIDSTKGYPIARTIINEFGSFKNALIEAELFDLIESKHCFNRKQYSKVELLELLVDYVQKYNRIPTAKNNKKEKYLPSTCTYAKYFGSWNNALYLIGYNPIDSTAKSNEELINKLKELYINLDRVPTTRDVSNSITYLSRFETWYNALDKAGIPHKTYAKQLNNQEIINEWYKIKNRLKKFQPQKTWKAKK